MKMQMKNRLHRRDINKHRSRHGHKYRKCKKWFSVMMLKCIKQHLSNIKLSKLSNSFAYIKKKHL